MAGRKFPEAKSTLTTTAFIEYVLLGDSSAVPKYEGRCGISISGILFDGNPITYRLLFLPD